MSKLKCLEYVLRMSTEKLLCYIPESCPTCVLLSHGLQEPLADESIMPFSVDVR